MITPARKVLALLDRREQLQLGGLCVVMLVVALVQTAGIASILPFMSIASNPAMISESKWIGMIYQLGGFETPRTFLLFSGLLLLGFMTFSNLLSAFEAWLMFRIVWRREYRLSSRLLAQYLDEPYTFFLSHNISTLTKHILTDTGDSVAYVMVPGLRIISQSLVIVCVMSLLFFVDAAVALAAILVLGGGYAMVYVLARRRLAYLGAARSAANEYRYKTVNEALASVKETKVLEREAAFQNRFQSVSWRYANINTTNSLITALPRFALETLAFGGIILIAIYLIQTRDDFGEAIAVMSLYAFAAYRLMPALQQVFRSAAEARFYLPAVDSLHAARLRKDSRTRPGTGAATRARPLTFQKEISLEGIGYHYPGSDVAVLDDLTVHIPKNSSVAFVGSTGSGKTTLLDILLGLLEPDGGSIRVDDIDLKPGDLSGWRAMLGYVPQQIYLCDDSIRRNIAFGVPDEEIDHAAVERAAGIANLHEFIVGLPAGYETEVGDRGVRLSGGQRQRIGIARALYRDPDVLVMDEATSALDGMTEEAVIQAIQQIAKRKTMIIVAHRLTTVRDCDTIYMLERGKVVASGTYRELLRTNVTFRSMAREGIEEVPVR